MRVSNKNINIKKEINYLFFPRTPLASLSMSAWLKDVKKQNHNQEKFNIILALPILPENILNTILLPWKKTTYKSFYFDYNQIEYYPGIFGFKSIGKIRSGRLHRENNIRSLRETLNSELSKSNLQLNNIDFFCFTSEHPVLLHNILEQRQKIYYFEHGFGDYAIFLSFKSIHYQLWNILRKFVEKKFFILFRSNFITYQYVSIFGTKINTPIFDENFISEESISEILELVTNQILKKINISEIDVKLDDNFVLVSLDQVEFFHHNEFENFIRIIYRDYIKLKLSLPENTKLMIKPREDISEQKLNDLLFISKKIDHSNIKIFLGLKSIHINSELICFLFNIHSIFTHGYTISAFLNLIGKKISLYNLNPYYKYLFGIELHYKKRFKTLRRFKKHHRLINKILRKYKNFSHLKNVGEWQYE